MSNRYHNKFHRANHHTYRAPNVPDSGYDPIASQSQPFLGNFYLSGALIANKFHDLNYNISAIRAFMDNLTSGDIFANTGTFTVSAYSPLFTIDYLDIKYYETSGFGISGSEISMTVPSTFTQNDKLILNNVGLSGNKWASFRGEVKSDYQLTSPIVSSQSISGNNLFGSNIYANTFRNISGLYIYFGAGLDLQTSDIIGVDTITSETVETDVLIHKSGGNLNVNSNLNLNSNDIQNIDSLSANYGEFDTVKANNFIGLSTSNAVIYSYNGYFPPVVSLSTTISSVSSNQTIYSVFSPLSVDHMYTISIRADNWNSYGEFNVTLANGAISAVVGSAKVSNFGNLVGTDVAHPENASVYIDNENTFNLFAPSGCTWSLDSEDIEGPCEIVIYDYQQRITLTTFDAITLSSLNATTISAQNLLIDGCILTNCLSTNGASAIVINNNLDMNGFSISNIANNSLTFNSGASIKSNDSGSITLDKLEVNLQTNINDNLLTYTNSSNAGLPDLSGIYVEGFYIAKTPITQNNVIPDNVASNWITTGDIRDWNDLAMSSDGKHISSVVFAGQIYISSNGGISWTAKESNRNWHKIAMSSDGKYQIAVAASDQIYISSDYGNTWTAKESSRNWRGVDISSDGKYQTATVIAGQIYISSDYGNTWTAKESNRSWYAVAMSSNGKYQTAVASSGQIYISSDYGNTWTAKESIRSWRGISMSSNGKYQTAVATSDQIYISSDYGNTWTAKESSRSWNKCVVSPNGQIQTAVVNGGGIYSSTNFGMEWHQKKNTASWTGIGMSSDGKIHVACIYGGQLAISTSDDILKTNSLTMETPLSSVTFTTSSYDTFINPITASGYLIVTINGVDKAIQLYDFTT